MMLRDGQMCLIKQDDGNHQPGIRQSPAIRSIAVGKFKDHWLWTFPKAMVTE